MTEVRHLLVAEDLRIVSARQYGSAPTSATIQQALEALGATSCLLALLPPADQTRWALDEGVWKPYHVSARDPVSETAAWTIDAPLFIPPQVTLLIAPAVTIMGQGVLHVARLLLVYRPDWYQGTGRTIVDGDIVFI